MSSELSAASARYDIILRSIPRQVPTAVFQSLVVALVLSWLDYCNNVLVGLPANLIRRLQYSRQDIRPLTIFQQRHKSLFLRRSYPDLIISLKITGTVLTDVPDRVKPSFVIFDIRALCKMLQHG